MQATCTIKFVRKLSSAAAMLNNNLDSLRQFPQRRQRLDDQRQEVDGVVLGIDQQVLGHVPRCHDVIQLDGHELL